MIMISLAITFLWLKHPLSMGLILICQTFIVAMLTGMMLSSFLFSYIIVIIMLSGALVLFIYMASVASNEKFQTPIKLIILYMLINTIMPFLMDKSDHLEHKMNLVNMKPEILSLMQLFNSTSAYITMMMILYLLLTMIIVSNIASVKGGPLRMKY
uniref:NADH-ubiquinone oxidoreductase chain 6 n=1 Tax=Adrisa magna TaxID=1289575 RepID=A0A4Y1JNE3_9HEMI|nr:NADH dehydrogenase subunit 6 [Adrisa magna]AMR75004.1 NADH dehydrogenase subunit 6 [Adrisa magna]